MEVTTAPERCPDLPRGAAVTIGAYDGVHLGHQAVIAEVRRLAEERGCASAVVTFDRHPARIVRPDSAPRLLTDLDQKLELLAATGVDHALVIPFDEARAAEPAEDFVKEILVGCLRTRAIVVGEDFHFGHGRSGNVALLREMGPRHGFDVVGMGLVTLRVPGFEGPVSSTAIRRALDEGRVELAARVLGRPHEVRGRVAAGDRRATELGFPTANVDVPAEIMLPADGIYAGWYLRPDGGRHAAAISLGRRPTFYEDAATSLLEAHLLDFSGELYGEEARVAFVARLRDEERFESPDALVQQMARDVAAARRILDR
ncbi:MAG: bifunctional riboflavin kinase/FAD synthetase [Acidimicrobiales bacterium]